MFTSKGIVHLDSQNNLKLNCDEELVNYYFWFLRIEYPSLKLQRPKFGSHLSLISTKHCQYDTSLVKKYIGKRVKFTYYPERLKSGGRDFTNFWLDCECEFGHYILNTVGIKYPNWLGFHLSIANSKNLNIKNT